MKLFHLSDLHLGKRLNDFSLLEDQKHILTQILSMVRAERPNAVIIAGDIYDKAVPPAEAVALFDDFLSRLSAACNSVFIVSGNHDSPERLAFGASLMEQSGVYLSPVYNGALAPVTLSDEYGEVDFYLLPFVKPAHVRRFFPEQEIESSSDALSVALSGCPKNPDRRNVLIAHQLVLPGSGGEGAEVFIGSAENVDNSVFDGFDYVALGHLHVPHGVSRPTLRYCGSPIKYSFYEAKHEKTVTVLELLEPGHTELRELPLTPLHDMRELRGSYEELTLRQSYENTKTDDYLRITLTDEEDVPEALAKLRVIYPNLMQLLYDNSRTRAGVAVLNAEGSAERPPAELFAELYEKQNGAPMSSEQEELITRLISEIWEV